MEDDTKCDVEKVEKDHENIDVYDFIMDESKYNKYHMNIPYPIGINKNELKAISLYDICDSVSSFYRNNNELTDA